MYIYVMLLSDYV